MTGQELKSIRQAYFGTQRALADALGYTEDHVRHLECGWANIPKRFIKQLDTLIRQKKAEKMLNTP